MRAEVLTGPCPGCGSPRARWRGRRFYDKLLTWLLVSAIAYPITAEDCSTWMLAYEGPPQVPLQPIAALTPKRFWRCPDCGQRGEEYS